LPTSANDTEPGRRARIMELSRGLSASVPSGSAGSRRVGGDASPIGSMRRGRTRSLRPRGSAKAFKISASACDIGPARTAPKDGWVGCRTYRLPPRHSRALGRHHQPCGGSRRNAISDCPVIIRNSASAAPIRLRRRYPHCCNQPRSSSRPVWGVRDSRSSK
jgi:hypothetical protein